MPARTRNWYLASAIVAIEDADPKHRHSQGGR